MTPAAIAEMMRGRAPGRYRVACPACAMTRERRRDDALSVLIEHDSGAYTCHRCGLRGGWRDRLERHDAHRPQPAAVRTRPAPLPPEPQPPAGLAPRWLALWNAAQPINHGTTAHSYLRARGCVIPPADSDLRCTEALAHPSGYVGPALVALVTDAVTAAPMSLHRTWITAAGRKADVEPPRMLLSHHPKAGGVIRLWPDEAVTLGLCIGEGVETCLAAAHAVTPVWACIDAGNLAAMPVLDGIESLTIAVDHDAAGVRAARACADRWARAGREVHTVMSEVAGFDLADEGAR